MAGYSGTPLVKKLGLKPGMRTYILDQPHLKAPYKVPAGVKRVRRATRSDPIEFIHVFCKQRDELEKMVALLSLFLAPAEMLWVSWPKGASKLPTELSENAVRESGLKAGLVDVKVCAIDDVWSGLKFVIRVKDRPRT